MVIKNFILMHIGTTQNGLEITREMAKNSYQSFNQIPVILVDKSIQRDYLSDSPYANDTIIGMVAEDSCHIDGDDIVGTVILWDDISTDKIQYDNWCINLYEDPLKFTVDAIELFAEIKV